ncbi:MAG TPA: ATP-dependent DNA helicase RecG [Candidatus Dojkabacteria bacterium]|nr:ATP-dependent DNA helicase RecG [Candidatus Dojkabacteria bacterium]
MAINPLNAEVSITELPGIGKVLASKFQKLGIEKIIDLIYHFPVRYLDTTEISSIQDFLDERQGTLLLKIESVKTFRTPRKRMIIVEAIGSDGQSFISLKWFNQPYIARSLKIGERYLISGKLTVKYSEYFIGAPEFELVRSDSTDDLVHLGRITPIYPETAGISSKRIRALLKILKPKFSQLVPEKYTKAQLEKYSLISLVDAVEIMHFPESFEDIESARNRLAFDEIYNIQKTLHLQKQKQKRMRSECFVPKVALAKLISDFPYKLTQDQEKCIEEIISDIGKKKPMHRMLIGDVGSGKTIVALAGMVTVLENGYSAILMAPTTVLAHQHYESVKKYLPSYKDKIKLITGEFKDKISPDAKCIYIGTHALLHTKEKIDNVGMVVVDEQHRFGVKQRGKIAYVKDNNGKVPHYLIMSATPIPRTLALSLYGNLDLSVINELPPGRIPIKTKYIKENSNKEIVYKWITEKINLGRNNKNIEQLIVICPLIEESEILEAESVIKTYENLKNGVFKQFKIVALHGRMKDVEKKKILDDFADGKYDILVGTPVIEVGIDIPNATMMIIENAERFGLAQLHQLRGRIGRRQKESFCFIFGNDKSSSEDAVERLKYFSHNSDGLKVAEFDLKRRGPGEVYGIKQAGIPELRFANLMDKKLIEKARDFIISEK